MVFPMAQTSLLKSSNYIYHLPILFVGFQKTSIVKKEKPSSVKTKLQKKVSQYQ